MNREHDHHDDGLDRLLHDAFSSRPVPLVDRPSVLDVQRRARRRTQRRAGAMVGCTAVVALGGAGLWAARQDPTSTSGVGDAAAPDGTYCLPVTATTYPPTTIGFIDGTTTTMYGQQAPNDSTEIIPTTAPNTIPTDTYTRLPIIGVSGIPTSTVLDQVAIGVATTVPFPAPSTFPPLPPGAQGTYMLVQGDMPMTVAEKFDVTVEELDAANVDTAGYDSFYVGLTIVIPNPTGLTGTTTTMPVNVGEPGGGAGGGGIQCFPNAPTEWHCTGPLGTDADGRDVYQACEPAYEGWSTTVVPTTSIVDGPVGTLDPLPTTAITMPPVTDLSPTTTSTIAIVGTTG